MGHAATPPGKKPEKAPNHERWVISYADLLTLLLATFVVLYASSTRDKHKMDEEAASFVKAFHGSPPTVATTHSASRGVMQHQPSPVPKPVELPTTSTGKISRSMAHQLNEEMLSLQKVAAQLNALLHPMIEKHEVTVVSQPLTLTIQLDASVLFPSGEAALKPPAVVLLKQVAASLINLPPPFTIIVQGFTDDQPIATAQFPSNWSLSAARAVTVVGLFAAGGVPGGQLAAEGFGEFSPVVPNSSAEGRAANRRVVVVVHAPDLAGK
jgi:chemotaxis protein MotB